MKIATFNVNGITARLPRLLEWLAETKPDVVCLQELKTSDETFPAAALREAGYSAAWHGQKGFNGVAVLARGDDLRRGTPRAARRPRRHPQPLPRSDDARPRRRLDLPAERQPAAGAEVRLQAGLVRPPRRARGKPRRAPGAGRSRGRLQRRRDRRGRRHLLAALLRQGRAAAAGDAERLPPAAAAGLDRLDPAPASRRADLHVLGLLPQPVRARRRPAHRPPAAERGRRGAPRSRRRRPLPARPREAERPRAGVDHAARVSARDRRYDGRKSSG